MPELVSAFLTAKRVGACSPSTLRIYEGWLGKFAFAVPTTTGCDALHVTAFLSQNVILPSLQTVAKWEQEGKIKGGVLVGERAGVFIVEADSHEALGDLLASLPFWGIVKWHVTPLQSFASTVERNRAAFQRATVPR